jgi:DNA-binding response OmpR family regulator
MPNEEASMVTRKQGLAGSKILVVEDQFLIADCIATSMKAAGATVIGPAGTARDALALIEHDRPDAAVVDVVLADGTADQLVRRLRQLSVPFIVATGYASSSLAIDYASAPYLEKPYELATLVLKVISLLPGTL